MWLAASGIFFLSLVVTIADRAGVLSPFRPALHDALSPGRLMVLAMSSGTSPGTSTETNSPASASDAYPTKRPSANEKLLRQLMIENARLRRDLKLEKTNSTILQHLEPLNSMAQYNLISASVVSAGGLPNALKDLIIDAGKSAGVTRSELVLEGTGPLLDAGSEKSVSAGDRVLAGAIVVGRIDKAARWVSMVQPVTAAGFKAQIMLLRQTPDGLHFGASGMLEGIGETECTVTGIPHTEAVAVGDDVVSADVNGVRGPRLYFGRVVRADFLAGGQWDVRVQPAASLTDLETVGILKLSLAKESTETTTNENSGRRSP